MSEPKGVLVLDCGTSALKATAFSPQGEIIRQAETGYGPQPAPHRHDPNSWWTAAAEAVKLLAEPSPRAIVLTGTMENLIVLDEDGNALTHALLYSDPCGAPYLESRAAALDTIEAARIAGNSPEPLMTAFRIAYWRDWASERRHEARWFLPGSKDYLAFRLTGALATDAACAATTGLMDMVSRSWSPQLASAHDVAIDTLPSIRPATDTIGYLTKAAALHLGLSPGIPVINGCGDGAATTVGSGAEHVDDISLYLGSSGWVARVVAPGDLAPRQFYRLPHPLTDDIVEIAPILSAGGAAQWARTTLGLDIEAAERLARAADADPGEALFLPYLNGERSPFTDLNLRAGFAGVSLTDGPGQLYYAALEGVAFAIAANLTAMGGSVGRVSLVGGGALSAIWPQIIADVLGTEIAVPADPVAASSLGAFRIAARALGLSVASTGRNTIFMPRPGRQPRIAKMRARFELATSLLRRLQPARVEDNTSGDQSNSASKE